MKFGGRLKEATEVWVVLDYTCIRLGVLRLLFRIPVCFKWMSYELLYFEMLGTFTYITI